MKTSVNKICLSELDYDLWIRENEKDIFDTELLQYNPLISVVVPVYNTEDKVLDECIQSVLNQTYDNWELNLVDDCSTMESVRPCLEKYATHPKVNVSFRKENGNISETTNDAIKMATGEFIGFLDCDDTLAPNALYEVAKKLNENPELDFIYSDEDKITEDGEVRHQPFFKPDWSPDTFWSYNYCNHFSVYRKMIVDKTNGLRTEYNGAQDYDFVLRFMEETSNQKVGHISKILYHWRESATSTAAGNELKPYVKEAARKLKEEALQRRGIAGHVEWIEDAKEYRVVFEAKNSPMVSIVILSKDHKDILEQGVTSIEKHTSYPNYEIIVVDNGSSNKEEIAQMLEGRAKYIYQPMDFNFSAQCNIGAKAANGEYILLLNDDVEIIQDDWLDRLVGQASLNYVGAVGAKLYYPNTKTIQHAGVINIAPGPSHALMFMDDDQIYYFGRNRENYNYLAVTGACLLCSKDKYFEVGGLDESLPVAYNDIDFCFKLYEKGYYNVLRNDVVAYHHESLSRGNDALDKKKMERLVRERKRLYSNRKIGIGEDPFYNINLVDNNIDFSLNVGKKSTVSNAWTLLDHIDGQAKIYGFSLDHVISGSVIKIIGWSTSGNYEMDEKAKKSLLLKLNDNYIIELETFTTARYDVMNVIESKALHTGFAALIDSSIFKGEARNYTLGIKYVLEGKVTYSWSIEQIELTEDDTVITTVDCEEIGKKSNDIVAYVDNAMFVNERIYIRGWSMDTSDKLYNNRYLRYLVMKQGDVYKKVVLHTKYRSDIVLHHQDYANMLYTGFETVVNMDEIDDLKNVEWYMVYEDMMNHTLRYNKVEMPDLSNVE